MTSYDTYKKLFLCIFTLLFVHLVSYAQGYVDISGRIVDENNEAVEYASVAVFSADKAVAGTITDAKGSFQLKVPAGHMEYRLSVEFIGYAKKSISVKAESKDVNLGDIVLENDALHLNEAIITGKSESHKSSVERTSINAAANIGASKGTAIDLLSTASAISVNNDAISIRGNSNILILIDGVPTTLSDLSAIPAANIKNIEILTNPDASYDSEGTGGIINIISKKEKATGLSGVIAANYGFNHFVAANAALSYVNGKGSYRFTYNTRYEDDLIDGILERKILSTGARTYQQMQSDRYVFNTNVGLGADFKLNKKNTLGIDLNLILPRLNVQQNLHNTHTYGGISDEESRHNDVTFNRENIEAVITYKHIIKPEISDISFRGSVSKIWGHRPSYYYLEGSPVNSSNSGGSPFISAIQGDFKQKISKGMLSAGVKLTYRRNNQYHKFYDFDNGNWIYSDQFSTDLTHSEVVPAAYVMFASKIGKRFNYKTGIRGEYSHVTLNSAYGDLNDSRGDLFIAPSLSAEYAISASQNLSAALSRRIGRPTYPQLNPYMSMVDATTYEQGNMMLLPEKSTKFDLAYDLKWTWGQLFINGYFNHTKDYISQITTIKDELLITTYINTPTDIKAGADVSFKVKPVKWMDITLNANTYHVNIIGQQNGMDISNGGWVNNSNILLNVMPTRTTDIQVQYFLYTPQYFAQLTTALSHYMNIAVKQKFFKGRMTLTASLTDVLKARSWTVYSSNEVFEMTNHSINKSRMLWLGISYNFNSFKQKKQEKKGETDRSLIRLGL